MLIQRTIEADILSKFDSQANKNKIIVIYGPRQVGKTTLANSIIKKLKLKTLKINADEEKYLETLSSKDFSKLHSLVAGYDLIFIDEAQRMPEIGINLKILIDNLPELKIMVTGSSSFEIANKLSEPLTGRTWSYTLYPISFLELSAQANQFELHSQLEDRLIYGSYPEIFDIPSAENRKKYLLEISNSYLYKDILQLANIKNSDKLKKLLKLLALQLGGEVSLTELGSKLEMSKDTVAHYIDLLEKSFVIFRLSGFSRNLRKEVTKMDKIYFYDLGIRNILIDNLHTLEYRNDTGALWENFLIIERLKYLRYNNIIASNYFWRLHTGAEIDYVEQRDGKLYGYEFKWSDKKAKPPKTWLTTYENASYEVVGRGNYFKLIIKNEK